MMKTKSKINIYNAIADLRRNFHYHPTTRSQCECGRMSRRGGGECIKCIADHIVATGKVSHSQMSNYIQLLTDVWKFEQWLVDILGD